MSPGKNVEIVNAFVLINMDGKDVKGLAERLVKVKGVTEVYPVAGEYDMICVVRVKDNSTLTKVVTEKLLHMKGVRHTKTLFAMDVYSKFDLAKLFSV